MYERPLFIVDPEIACYEQLLAELSSTDEVLMLNPSKEGILQIVTYLQGDYESIYFLFHGVDSHPQLGNRLTARSLEYYCEEQKMLAPT